MTEEKVRSKLQVNAKEFIPKSRGILTRESRSGSLSLNVAAKEFIPKTSPILVPLQPPFMFIPPLVPEGTLKR